MPILRSYGFTEPEFYQPPAWRWIREIRKDQNSKAKYYEEIPMQERGVQKYEFKEKEIKNLKKIEKMVAKPDSESENIDPTNLNLKKVKPTTENGKFDRR